MDSKDAVSDDGKEEGEEVPEAQLRAEDKLSENEDTRRSDEKSRGGLKGQALILAVQEYFYDDDDLARLFERFVNDKCSVVDLDAEEHKLEYTAAYEEYKSLFELKIGGFIEDTLGVRVEDFYDALQAKTAEDEWSNEAIFGQILIAVTDFDVFMQMMREGKKGNKVSHK